MKSNTKTFEQMVQPYGGGGSVGAGEGGICTRRTPLVYEPDLHTR